jgi:xylulokinase
MAWFLLMQKVESSERQFCGMTNGLGQLATGGGARSIIWLQILADVLQSELIAPRAEEGAAYGATILAMVGVGAYPNLEAAFKMLPQEDNTVQPQANPVYEAGFKRYELLYEALKAVR